ncbi:type II secretion system protein GspH [Aliidiomarina taiwanensis]|uniref:Type II secretion system protein H n=1 Tax=Aliidiomarina taiwanensis TaxID=946228 RepID=A0A432X8B9_9GAMM|nr:type II secretion system minor pseudopilin GspH [Aliidiomarina taiwanensis]RUO42987.1 type II secretion system protein GspH [Aliidiomarina taiwanensis]
MPLLSENRLQPQQQGFTLIELLLVVAIIGVAALTIVLQLPSRSHGESSEDLRQQFELKFHYAREQALLRHWVIGVEFSEQEYRFYRWQQDRWQAFTEKPLLPVSMPEQVDMTFLPGEFRLLDNRQQDDSFLQSEQTERDEDEAAPQPQVIIFESTEFIPFRLQWDDLHSPIMQLDASDGVQLKRVEGALW